MSCSLPPHTLSDPQDTKTGNKRRRTGNVVSELNPQSNPFANAHINLALQKGGYVEELAQLHVMSAILYYEQHNRCQVCHEPIDSIPFTLWTCGTCFLCEQCICMIYDKHRFEWSRRRSNVDFVSNIENAYPTNARSPAQTFEDTIKCYICRPSDRERTCRTVMPGSCNVSRYMLGREFTKSFQNRPVPRTPSSLSLQDLEAFNQLRNTLDPTKTTFTCPHCKVLTFRYSQIKQYMKHQTVCVFRLVHCPFADCDVMFLPRILNYASMGTERFDSLLEVSSTEITTKLEDHFLRECKHKVLCNVANCKLHEVVGGDDKQGDMKDAKEPKQTRILQVHQLHEHALQNLKTLPLMSMDDLTKKQPMWSENEMKAKFPDDHRKCQHEIEEELVIPRDPDEDPEDDDGDHSSDEDFVTRVVIRADRRR